MSTVHVPLGDRSYDIVIDALESAQSSEKLAALTAGRSVLLVADSNTVKFADRVTKLCAGASKVHTVHFPAGEASKTFATAAMLCGEAAKAGCDRSSIFIALGGGVTGDLTGFAASIFMRGVDFVQVPTSLLAMVDSSVGGKTGVDLPEGKNLAGTFYQPKLVLIDPDFLNTLPERELVGAMAEIVKYGIIADSKLFGELENFTPAMYGKLIQRSCEIKAQVVAADEKEQGCRAWLNYGHTFGHAAELLSDFKFSHGEAVAIGMVMAGRLAVLLNKWSESDNRRQTALLEKLGLPTRLGKGYAVEAILDVMSRDKKTRNGKFNLVLPQGIGSCYIEKTAPRELIISAIEESF